MTPENSPTTAAPTARPRPPAIPPETFRDWFPSAVGWGTALGVVGLILWPRVGDPMGEPVRLGWPVSFYVLEFFRPASVTYVSEPGFSGSAFLLDLAAIPVMCTITVLVAHMVAHRQFRPRPVVALIVALVVMRGILMYGPKVTPQFDSYRDASGPWDWRPRGPR